MLETFIAAVTPSSGWVVIAVLILLAMLSRKTAGNRKRTID